MVTRSRKWFLIAVLLSTIAADGARGQWLKVAPGIAAGLSEQGGLCYNEGILWLATPNTIYQSKDSGLTWNSVGNASGTMSDLVFCDSMHGILAGKNGTFLSTDKGSTWSQVSSASFSACFGNAPSVIAVAGRGSNSQQLSTDAGLSWSDGPSSGFSTYVRNRLGVISFFGGPNGVGYMSWTSDEGKTWQTGLGGIGYDSYSFAIDSCDDNLIYVSHEDFYLPTDHESKIFVSTNKGGSWTTEIAMPDGFLSGSIAESRNSIYCATDSEGILRSLDHGATWKSIGGPNIVPDTRLLAVVNDNIIVAGDAAGNIWRTMNSGGDSVIGSDTISTFAASPSTVFLNDTIVCDSLTHSVSFQAAGCPLLFVSSAAIIGSDSASYHVSDLTSDSIQVTLYGTILGNHNAKLVLNLDNGSSDTVSLAGNVNVIPENLALSTADVKTDTLGATVAVPITINGLVRPEDIDLILHYDGTVDYIGSFSPSGAKLDIPGEQWAGRSELHIAGAASDVVAGYAKFNVFNDSGENAHVSFDSVNVLTAISPCEYSMPQAVTSTITAPTGCGITILSQFVHLGIEPSFSVRPNPASGEVWFSSSNDLGDVTFAIYDMLGVERSEIVASVSKDIPVELTLPNADGVYNIVANYSSGKSMMRVVREHY